MANQTTPAIQVKDSNVGIGTTSPESKLHVAGGQLTLKGGTATEQQIVFNFAREYVNGIYNSSGHFRLQDNSLGGTVYQWDGSSFCFPNGNVGIGTTSPGAKLDIYGASPTTVYESQLRIYGSETTGAQDTGGAIAFSGHDGGAGRTFGSIRSMKENSTVGNYAGYMSFGTRPNNGDLVERLRITSAGNVGIGTTSPSSKFEVYDSANSNTFTITSDGANEQFRIRRYSNTNEQLIIGFHSSDYGYIQTVEQGVAYRPLSLNPNGGNVGIGTTSPTNKLQVTGGRTYLETGNEIYTLGISRSGANAYYLGVSNSSSPDLYFSNNAGTTRVTLTDAGNVGIGTSSPNTKLEVFDGDISVTTGGTFSFLNLNRNFIPNSSGVLLGGTKFRGYSTGTTYQSGVYIYGYSTEAWTSTSSPGYLSIQTTPSGSTTPVERMVVTSAGNVGIGTTSPAGKLHIADDGPNALIIGDTQVSTIGETNNGDYPGMKIVPYNSNIHIGISSTNDNKINLWYGGQNYTYWQQLETYSVISNYSTSALVLQVNGGNVGIGTTSPSNKLEVLGSATIRNSSGAGFLTIGTNSGRTEYQYITLGGGNGGVDYGWQVGRSPQTGGVINDGFYIYDMKTNNAPFAIALGGNVGIGTTSPSSLLDVYNGSGWGAVDIDGTSGGEIRLQKNGTTYGNLYASDNSSTAFVINAAQATDLILQTNSSERLRITSAGNVGIWTTAPQKRLEVISVTNDFVSIGVAALAVGNWTGIHFGYRESNTFYRKSAIVFERTDLTANDAQGKIHILNGPQGGSGSATLADAKLTIAENGNVGIGTTTPSSRLQVTATSTSATTVDNGITILNNSAVNNCLAGIRLSTYGDVDGGLYPKQFIGAIRDGAFGAGKGSIVFCNRDAADTSVVTLSDEKMRILPDGNVGIGTTAPNTKLNIQEVNSGTEGLIITNWNAVNTLLLGSDSSAGGGKITLRNNAGTSNVFISSYGSSHFNGGNVGIGTTSPSEKLHIYGTSNQIIKIENSGTYLMYLGLVSNEGYIGSTNATPLTFYTNNVNRMYINTSGNVGIGTTSPTEKLHVDGNVIVTYNNSYQGINSIGNKAILARVSPTTGIINYAEYATAANLNGFVIGSDDARVKGNIATDSLEFITNGSTRVTVLSNGDVGIGTTSPTEKLQVNGSLKLDDGNADGPQLKLASSGYSDWNIDNFSGSLRAYYGSTEYTRLTSSGNFGIGVTPSYKLDVAGDTRITSGSLGVGVLPDATDGRIDASNDIVAYSSSDRRLKENITPIANALDKVKSLTGVEFDWKPEHKKAHGYEGHDTGVIAQEVQEVMPTAVRTNNTGYLAVRYEKLIGLLIEANKELAARVEELEKKLK